MDGDDTPSPSSSENLLVPVAGIILILIVFFLVGVVVLICIRKILLNRGVDVERWQLPCKCVSCSCCTPCCLSIAETLDCDTPDTKVWLDNVCPTQQQCSAFWGKVFSCYCCYAISDACKDIQLCPDCSCPSCTCPCDCECECTVPQCHEINCICFKINL